MVPTAPAPAARGRGVALCQAETLLKFATASAGISNHPITGRSIAIRFIHVYSRLFLVDWDQDFLISCQL